MNQEIQTVEYTTQILREPLVKKLKDGSSLIPVRTSVINISKRGIGNFDIIIEGKVVNHHQGLKLLYIVQVPTKSYYLTTSPKEPTANIDIAIDYIVFEFENTPNSLEISNLLKLIIIGNRRIDFIMIAVRTASQTSIIDIMDTINKMKVPVALLILNANDQIVEDDFCTLIMSNAKNIDQWTKEVLA